MIRELETVVLLHDVPQRDLKSGNVGAVVHRYREEKVFDVEFVTAEGGTTAVLTNVRCATGPPGTGSCV